MLLADHDLAVQATDVGHHRQHAAGCVGLRLAHVVQQAAGDHHVAVDGAESRRDVGGALGDD